MKYWKRTDGTGKITTVESYSHDLVIEGATEIKEIEFNSFVASLPQVAPVPERDLAKEIDALKIQVTALSK